MSGGFQRECPRCGERNSPTALQCRVCTTVLVILTAAEREQLALERARDIDRYSPTPRRATPLRLRPGTPDALRRSELDAISRMNGPVLRRLRESCCAESGLPPRELERHFASVVFTLKTLFETSSNRRRPRTHPGAAGAARRSTA